MSAKLRFKSTGRRMLLDLYAHEKMNPSRVETMLALVSERYPSRATITAWTEEQQRHVINWAYREYLAASDNLNLRLERPAFLPKEAP